MNTPSALGLHPLLRGFPGIVLELRRDGVVVESNGALERVLERGVAGGPFGTVLDTASRRKLDTILTRGPDEPGRQPTPWELMLEGRDTVEPHSFYPVWDEDGGRLWLVECPRDPRFDQLYEELAAVNSEQANTQRQLAKEKARLSRALDELEREFSENERLSRALQAQNEEMEAQNEELLAMTEELHAGQDQLLSSNQQLERRSRELQIALSARNRFYAAMSHELRTPINAVMGYNDLLLAEVWGPLNEKQELAVERSQRAARHLRELVNDVLDISRLESGRMDVETEDVRLPELVGDLFETLKPLTESARTELHLVQEDGVPVVQTDPRRLRQILMNLLSNAIKFGEGSPVWVRISRGRGGGALLEVTDGGPGIAEEDQARIWDEFVQLDRGDNLSGAVEGTGLGLPIARRLATALGASLDVSSTVGLGTTFRLALPQSAPKSA
ncbi:sensor histidine kinase [Longimicrobium sp.]|uniref:sensor histidine kinase n=1 Tax=Longimicrobium sp. TaxID=2029185 RepID=UPI002E30E19A|nr:ATP-binding protein [Longimicrobium sp.]HEX6041545.1 ATP-binding protein [Longimicrobium sp.]